ALAQANALVLGLLGSVRECQVCISIFGARLQQLAPAPVQEDVFNPSNQTDDIGRRSILGGIASVLSWHCARRHPGHDSPITGRTIQLVARTRQNEQDVKASICKTSRDEHATTRMDVSLIILFVLAIALGSWVLVTNRCVELRSTSHGN